MVTIRFVLNADSSVPIDITIEHVIPEEAVEEVRAVIRALVEGESPNDLLSKSN